LGAIAEYRGDDPLAQQRYTEAWEVFRETNDDSLISFSLSNLADTSYRQGDLVAASRFARDAVTAARASGEATGMAVALTALAYIELAQDRRAAAIASLTESFFLSVDSGYQAGIANTIGGFGAVAYAANQLVDATKLLAAAESTLVQAGRSRLLNQRQFDKVRQSLHADLDPHLFSAAWSEGRSMTMTDVQELIQTGSAFANRTDKEADESPI
jgi:hypothetical protein